jgi:uncharacterized membrane protein
MNLTSTANQPHIVSALLFLFIAASAYAWLVRRLRQRNRDHNYTPWLVVVGNGLVVSVYTWLTTLEAGALLLICMAVAGAHMIVEYIDDWLTHNEKGDGRLDL